MQSTNTSPKSPQRRLPSTYYPRNGSEKILEMIVDNIRQAQLTGDKEHVVTLLRVLHHFLKAHPEARPSVHPWSKRFLKLRYHSLPPSGKMTAT